MAKKKASKAPRVGKVKSAAKAGEAATFEAGKAAAPAAEAFDEGEVCRELGMYWQSGKGDQFVLRQADGRWAVWPQQAVVDLMRATLPRLIAIKAREDEAVSEVKRVFLWARQNHCLDDVRPALPGYRSGIHVLDSGERVLVRTECKVPEPVAGDWPTIRAVVEGRLDLREEPGGVDQTPWFYSWCKVALESLMRGQPGHWRAGHAVILTGPAGCGKNRIQEQVITPLLGGRAADPQKFLFDADEFNGDVFAAEHLMLSEVPVPSQRTVDRTQLAERIKQVVANPAQRARLMRAEPCTLSPYWRLTISVNDDPDKLRSLPLITSDFGDKVLIFHCKRAPLPIIEWDSEESQRAFRDACTAEISAFAHWLLNEWEIPESLMTYEDGRPATRFGFREWHHPVIKGDLFADTPAAQLMQLIDDATFHSLEWEGGRKLWEMPCRGPRPDEARFWHDSAEELQLLLTGEKDYRCSVSSLAKKLFQHNQCGRMLGRLAAEDGIADVRVMKRDTRFWKGWKIGPPQ